MARIGFLVALIHCMLTAPLLAQTAPTSGPTVVMPEKVVRIELTRARNLLYVPVKINGNDAGLFLLDLGAQPIVMDSTVVRRLNLPKVGDGSMRGFGGSAPLVVHAIDEISLGSVSIRQTFGVVSEKSFTAETLMGDRKGIVGNNFLQNFPFRLSSREASLTLYDRKSFQPPADARRFELRMLNRMPAISARFEDGTHSGWFVCDTGAESGIYFQNGYVNLNRTVFESKEYTPAFAIGVGGRSDHRDILLSNAELLGARLQNEEAAYSIFDKGTVWPAAAGYVGMDVLARFDLTFDYEAGAVWAVDNGSRIRLEWERPDFDPRSFDATNMSPLSYAIYTRRGDYARKFLTGGVDIHAKDGEGGTALHYAARAGDVEMIKLLLAAGASVKAASVTGVTPLAVAARRAPVGAIAPLLAAGADIDAADDRGFTPIMAACVRREQSDVVAALIRAGADVNHQSVAQGTALHQAAAAGALRSIELLLDAQANPNANSGRSGVVPLMLAVQHGRTEVVKLLLARGASVNATSPELSTPLLLAASQRKTEIAKLLLAAGADQTARDKSGRNVLDYAAATGDLELLSQLYQRPAAPATTPVAP